MAKWFQKWSAFDSARSLGDYIFWGVCILFNTTGAALLAAAAAYTSWYWEAYGPIGVAFAFLISVLVVPLAFILIAVAAILAAHAKQRWSSPVSSSSDIADHSPAQINDDAKFVSIVSDVDGLKGIAQLHYEEFDQKHLAYSQGMSAMSDRLGVIERLLKPSRQLTILESLGAVLKPASNRFESIEASLCNAQERVGLLTEPLRERLDKFEERLEQLNSDTFDTFEKVRQVFHSERVMESYRARVTIIDDLAEKLNDPLSKPELYGDWSTWEHDFHQFKSQLNVLDRFLKANIDVPFNFFDTPNEKYASSNWSYNFKDMTDDQKLNYKTYRIMLGNYLNSKEEISSKIFNGTFLNL